MNTLKKVGIETEADRPILIVTRTEHRMSRKRHNPEQIINLLREAGTRTSAAVAGLFDMGHRRAEA